MISSHLLQPGMLSEGESLCPWQRLHPCERQHLDVPSSFKRIISTSWVIKDILCSFLFWVGINFPPCSLQRDVKDKRYGRGGEAESCMPRELPGTEGFV